MARNKLAERLAAGFKKGEENTQGITDRLASAAAMVNAHPIDETGPAGRTSAAVASLDRTKGLNVPGTYPATVKLEDIVENPFNARRIYKPTRINELAASIAAHGQDQPGLAVLKDGKYILAAGHYRKAALTHLGKATMDLMVRNYVSDKDLYELSYRENAEREEQTAMDNAIAWADLLAKGVYKSQDELAIATSVKVQTLSKTLAVLKLPEAVLEIVKDDADRFAMSVLYELYLYTEVAGLSKGAEMARLVIEDKVSRKDIEQARAALTQPRDRKTKENSRQYRIERDGAQIGAIKDWDNGKIVLEVTLNDHKEREALLTELRARFGLAQ